MILGRALTAAAATLVSVLVIASTAYAAAILSNAGFEQVTGSAPDDWTLSARSIDAGNTSNNLQVGSCWIPDLQDYTAMNGSAREVYQGGTFTAGVASGALNGNAPANPEGTYVLSLSSSMTTASYGVVHGPVAVSSGFNATAGQEITLDWFAANVSDDFAIFGYLLDTDGCEVYPVVSAWGTSNRSMRVSVPVMDNSVNPATVSSFTGGDLQTSSNYEWQRASVSIPETKSGNEYKFVFVSGTYDRTGGTAAGALLYIDNISVGDPQTISGFGSQTGMGLADSRSFSATASSGLPVTYTSTTTGICTISGATLTVVSAGNCIIRAEQSGDQTDSDGDGIYWAAAPSITQSFSIVDTRLTNLVDSESLVDSEFDADTVNYSLTVAQDVAEYRVTPTSAGATITVNGSSVTSGSQSQAIPLSYGANTVSIVVTKSGISSTFTISVTRTAPPSSSNDRKREVAEPVVVPVSPVPRPPAPRSEPEAPQLVDGPVTNRGVLPTPPGAPQALIGGRPTTVTTTVPTTTQLDVRAGQLNLGVKVLEDQGQISQSDDGTTEIAVRKGASATITGSGFRPVATVQVFMPLQGDNAKELTRIPVQPDGSFDGSAPFATRPNEAPLPIGKNVLQLVSLDNDGNQVVVEMSVNIAQGAPAPEQNRIDGVIPTMTPGQSVATSGGEPVPVRITPVSDQKLAVVEGDGWSMAINVAAEDGGVEPSEGGALLKLVRDESAVISGSGFMPGTRADVWLFSDPTLLGTVTIDENGEFTGEVNIDPNMIPVGEHTLQLQGVGEDGYVKAANLGVLVEDPVEAAPPTAVEQGLGLIWSIIAALVLLAVIVVLIASRRRRDA